MFKILRSALLLGALLLLAVTAAPGGVRAQSDDDVKTYTIPGDQVFPEGIAYDHDTGDFFVSSTTNGTIYRGNVDDSELKVFLKPGEDGRTTAIGLELDAKGRLWVAGGPTGKAWVYDAASGELFATISTGETGMENVFLNDIAVAPDGAGYITDSVRTGIYKVKVDEDKTYVKDIFLSDAWGPKDGGPLKSEEGFNINGIVATDDGKYLLTVQSNTGNLYRVDVDTSESMQVDLGGATLAAGDGMILDGQTLYVSRNQAELIVRAELADDYSSGEADDGFTNDAFMYPTTIAKTNGRLLAVNSQFDKRDAGNPELPFTVVSVPIPGYEMPDGPPDTGGGGSQPMGSSSAGTALGAALLLAGIGLMHNRRRRAA